MAQVINEEADIDELAFPELTIDKNATDRNFQYVSDIFGDILDVQEYYNVIHWYTYSMGIMGYGLDITKDNIREIIFKDLSTFRGEPERLKKLCNIAKELS